MLRILWLVPALLLAACTNDSNDHRRFMAEPTVIEESVPPLGMEVTLSSGMVMGQDHGESAVWEWLAIPFAQPPVGDLRWKAPRDPEPWEGTHEALSFGEACPQLADAEMIGDEDCLHLNVWRPRSEERDLPVYVWIHGGSNTSGANSWSAYQGDRVAQNSNVVVVSIQYRLGPLGWFNFEPLHSGDPLDDSGNYGTLDIIHSLKWIQDNIEGFGGDKGNVTITGESAGAMNIVNLLLSDLASGLFHKAIVQSGFPVDTTVAEAREEAASFLASLVQFIEAPTDMEAAQALRAATPEELIRNSTVALYSGITDGTVLPTAGVKLFETAEHVNKVPMIVGTNKDEAKLWTSPLFFNTLDGSDPALIAAAGRYASDAWRVIGADDFATDITAAPDQPDVYLYRFNWGSPDALGRSPLPGTIGESLGAHHAMEVSFVLGNWEEWVDPRGTALLFNEGNAAGRENLSDAIVAYFAAFAHSGNPNTANQTSWEPFSVDGEFKAITLDVNLDDNLANLTADTEAWTIETVLADLRANVDESFHEEVEMIILEFFPSRAIAEEAQQ